MGVAVHFKQRRQSHGSYFTTILLSAGIGITAADFVPILLCGLWACAEMYFRTITFLTVLAKDLKEDLNG